MLDLVSPHQKRPGLDSATEQLFGSCCPWQCCLLFLIIRIEANFNNHHEHRLHEQINISIFSLSQIVEFFSPSCKISEAQNVCQCISAIASAASERKFVCSSAPQCPSKYYIFSLGDIGGKCLLGIKLYRGQISFGNLTVLGANIFEELNCIEDKYLLGTKLYRWQISFGNKMGYNMRYRDIRDKCLGNQSL